MYQSTKTPPYLLNGMDKTAFNFTSYPYINLEVIWEHKVIHLFK